MDSGAQCYDKTAADLQENIVVKRDKITGTLKHTTGFQAFGEGEQDGNFLALALPADPDVEITTEVINGKSGPVNVGEERFCVYRITDKDRQKIKVVYKKGGDTVTKIYTLTGLKLKGE